MIIFNTKWIKLNKIKKDENTVKDSAEEIEQESITNFVTKVDILQKLIGKDAVKTKMSNVAGQ